MDALRSRLAEVLARLEEKAPETVTEDSPTTSSVDFSDSPTTDYQTAVLDKRSTKGVVVSGSGEVARLHGNVKASYSTPVHLARGVPASEAKPPAVQRPPAVFHSVTRSAKPPPKLVEWKPATLVFTENEDEGDQINESRQMSNSGFSLIRPQRLSLISTKRKPTPILATKSMAIPKLPTIAQERKESLELEAGSAHSSQVARQKGGGSAEVSAPSEGKSICPTVIEHEKPELLPQKPNISSTSGILGRSSMSAAPILQSTGSNKENLEPLVVGRQNCSSSQSAAVAPSSSLCSAEAAAPSRSFRTTAGQTQTVTVNGKTYPILNLLGKGGSSKVWQVFDETSERCLAVKWVDLSDADEAVRRAYENEIELLKALQHSPKIIRLIDHEKRGCEQLLVMEKGDTDLGAFLKTRQLQNDPLADKLIAFYWLEMLNTVAVVHAQGVIHSDLKPANFLLVGGNLKLIDFGIASSLHDNRTSVTVECQMGTLNYMSPEAVRNTGAAHAPEGSCRMTTASDVWSLGCILYSMVYGRTPFQHITNTYAKMMAIIGAPPFEGPPQGRRPPLPKQNDIQFPDIPNKHLLDVLKRCLTRNPKARPTVQQLLDHPYITNQPGLGRLSDDALTSLSEVMQASTPRTHVRLLKRVLANTAPMP